MVQPLTLNSNEDELEIDSSDDDKAAIIEQIGDVLPHFDVFKALVLVAIFQRDKIGKNSKILTAASTKKEDVYQGRIGLVLKRGPLAFVDSTEVKFCDRSVDYGDWAFYVPANGTRVMINGVECRLLEDVHIDGKVSDPYLFL